MWSLVCSKYIDFNLHTRLHGNFCCEIGAHIKFGTSEYGLMLRLVLRLMYHRTDWSQNIDTLETELDTQTVTFVFTLWHYVMQLHQ